MKTNNMILRKFVVSWMLAAIVPVMLLTLYIVMDFSRTLERALVERNFGTIETIMSGFESEVGDLARLSLSMASDKSLYMMNSPMSDYETLEIVERLKIYKNANARVSDVALVLNGQVYAATGTYKDEEFYFRVTFDSTPNPELSESAHKLKAGLKANRGDIDNFGYIFPFTFSERRSGYIIFSFSAVAMDETLRSAVYDNEKENLVVLDSSYKLLSQANDSKKYEITEAVKQIGEKSNYSGYQTLGDEQYQTCLRKGEISGLNYAIFSKKGLFGVNNKAYIILSIIAFVFMVEIIGIFYYIRTNYRPIQKIVRHFSGGSDRKLHSLNELGEFVGNMFDDNKALKKDALDKRPVIQNQLMQKLLSGRLENPEQIDKMISDFRGANKVHTYVVAIAKCTAAADMKQVYDVRLMSGTKIYRVDTMQKDLLVFVLSLNETASGQLDEILTALKCELETRLNTAVTLSCGLPQKDAAALSQSYNEAIEALEWRFVEGNSVIKYKDIIKTDNKLRPVNIDMNELSKRFILCDVEGIHEMIFEIIKTLKEYDVRAAKNICYDTVNTIVKAIQGLRLDFNAVLRKAYALIVKIENVTIDEITPEIMKLCAQICEILTDSKEDGAKDMRNEIIRYIDTHIFEPKFSMEHAASHFNISYSYFSRFFKTNFHMNLRDYVTQKRIDYAKELLKNTDMAIVDIVQMTGYYDASSFNSKFKKLAGLTPGEWRKMYTMR